MGPEREALHSAAIAPIRERLQRRLDLKAPPNNPNAPLRTAGYDGEWSEVEAEVTEHERQGADVKAALDIANRLSRIQTKEIKGLREDIRELTAVQHEILIQAKS